MDWKIKKAEKGLRGEIVVPADKSISHRAIMFGSIASGTCKVSNFLFGEDCVSTLEAFQAMGVEITRQGNDLLIVGKGLRGLQPAEGNIDLGNSGTSMRIISGILAGQDFETNLIGDESLSKRPMGRVVEPLKEMGANIETLNGDLPPIKIMPACGALKAIDYKTPVASAQVKSCVLAAGLYSEGETSVTEPFQSRDHTERMLKYFSADIKTKGLTTVITGNKQLTSRDITVPGDISSAAFLMVAALIVEGSEIVLKNVGLNSTRDGILRVLKRMGADLEIFNVTESLEPYGDIRVRSSKLIGTTIEADEIPLLIDEVPIIIVAASVAKGKTVINGISELKVKESDRVSSMKDDLSRLGVSIYEEGSSLAVEGGACDFSPADLDSFGDHRIAMSMAVAALKCPGECVIRNTGCVDTSYPSFLKELEVLKD